MLHPNNILKTSNLKRTKARVAVLDLLANAKRPFSVEDILKTLKKDSPDQATLYRILSLFTQAGLVREVMFKDGTIRYESTSHEHHHHAVCTDCGRIEDVDVPAIEQLIKKTSFKLKQFKRIQEHSLEFFGVCTSCERIVKK